MKKVCSLALLMLVVLLCACSNDEDIVEEVKPVYKVRVSNNIDKTLVSKKSDGVLYDVCLVCSDGNIYRLGNIANGEGMTYELPNDTKEGSFVFVALKFAKSEASSKSAYYWVPESSYAKIKYKFLTDGVTLLFNITEDTTYSQVKYNSYDDFAKYVKNLVGE